MYKKIRFSIQTLILVNAFLACNACAVAETKPTSTTPARELTDSTCAEYLDLLDRVKQEQKLSLEKQKSQDDVVSVMLWLHGYISGRNGVDNSTRPLNKEWISANVVKLAEVCAEDESKRIIDIASSVN